MTELYLTAYNGAILGPIAKALGWIMNEIYLFISNVFHINNIALTIIVFTIFIYLCLLPLTYRQQKFSVLTRKMQPELQAVQKKYKNKKDQDSMSLQQEETQAVYDKYGVSPTGSCVQALIQMPILFSLYRVFYNAPAYLSSVKSIFTDLTNSIVGTKGYLKTMNSIYENAHLTNVKVDFTSGKATTAQTKNYIIDVLYKLSEDGWASLNHSFPNLTDAITSTHAKLEAVNYFLVLNISDTPWNLIKSSFSERNFIILICALVIPICSYLTQVLNIKLMPSTDAGNDQMAKQMKTMNMMTPLISLFFTFTTPVGLGIYWIAGALVRSLQQFILNKHFEKIDLDVIVENNKEKAEKKKEKRGIRQNQILAAGNMSKKKSLSSYTNISEEQKERLEKVDELRSQAKSGSLTDKANMVDKFNNRYTK